MAWANFSNFLSRQERGEEYNAEPASVLYNLIMSKYLFKTQTH